MRATINKNDYLVKHLFTYLPILKNFWLIMLYMGMQVSKVIETTIDRKPNIATIKNLECSDSLTFTFGYGCATADSFILKYLLIWLA
jgi:hypothetical protein